MLARITMAVSINVYAMSAVAFAKVKATAPAPAPPPVSLVGELGKGLSSLPWTVVVLLTLLVFVPTIVLCMTPFVRLLVTFHFLRQALSTQSIPTNQTLIGLSLFLTYFIMQPVGADIYQMAFKPLESNSIGAIEALDVASNPMRRFMLKYTREQDLALFVELSRQPRPANPEETSMRVVIPAYILSELRAGFQIGVILFLPFLVVDLVVASITTSMGMLQLPPVVISTPIKILLFVMVDGWNLVVGSLVKSFY
jgi:flagellar biosynthetic protein FliP